MSYFSIAIFCFSIGALVARWSRKHDCDYWAEMTGHCLECKQTLYRINEKGDYEKI